MNFDVHSNTHLVTIAGSRAYGLNTESSDVDIKGIIIPTKEYFFGWLNNFEQIDSRTQIEKNFRTLFDSDEEIRAIDNNGLEGSIYDIRKFFKLASDCNPNILDILFCRDEEVRLISPIGQILRDNKDLFISAKAKHTFSGYAFSQLKRIKGHRAWLLNPPKAPPTRKEFDLPEETLIPKEQIKAIESSIKSQINDWNIDYLDLNKSQRLYIEEQISKKLSLIQWATDDKIWLAAARLSGASENFIYIMQKERAYRSAKMHWKQYNYWKANRNPERAALENKCGFDSKHASHLVRLLRMGEEILTKGEVNVWRGNIDRDELLAIRNGEWTYDQLINYSDSMDKKLTDIYNSKRYIVPSKPNRNSLDKMCIGLIEKSFEVI